MDWLVLLLLVPAILVPVVLLWGFAGCSFRPGVADPTTASNVHAEGISVSAIHVTWHNPNTAPVTFQIARTKEGESVATTLSASTNVFDDTGLEEATTYSYVVTAIRTSDNVSSDASGPASGRTFGVVFEAALTTDQQGTEGLCVVQRIEPTRLRFGTIAGDIQTPGARVRITVRGSTVADLTLDKIYISQPAASGDPYDAAADLTAVPAKGVPPNTPITISANTAMTLADIDYDLDKTRPLLIAFDISAVPGAGNPRYVTNVPATDAVMYFRAATAEASINDRSPSAANPGDSPYFTSASIYLVEKIEVV